MAKTWFVRTKSGKAGPYSLQQMKALIASGKLKERMQISRDGKEWIAACNVEALGFTAVSQAAKFDPLLQDVAAAPTTTETKSGKRKKKRRGKPTSRAVGPLMAIFHFIFVEVFSLKGLLFGAVFGAIGLFVVFAVMALNIMPFVIGAGLQDSAIGEWSENMTEFATSRGTLTGLLWMWVLAIVVGGFITDEDD